MTVNHPFVWLGSGRAKKRGVGHKGRLLDEATRAGLPVPAGGILLDEFYHLVLEAGAVVVEDGRIATPDPIGLSALLYDEVRFPRLKKPVVVRPTFSAPDQDLTGSSPAKLFVDFTDPIQVATSLGEIWSSALKYGSDLRRDVLVMEMVEVQVVGTVVGEQGVANDRVSYTTGTPYETRSSVAKEALLLPRLHAWQATTQALPPFARRLQKLLRGMRRTFGQENWGIAWADDGAICWLIEGNH
jgi:hypothetical protein